MEIVWSILSQVGPYIAGLVLLIGSAWGLIRHGEKKSDAKHEARGDKAYIERTKEMGDVEVGSDPDAARRWLHERGNKP